MTRPKTKRAEAKAKVARAAIPQDQEILTEKQAATFLNFKSAKTLYSWRRHGNSEGPLYAEFGGHIRYRRADLVAWVEAHLVPKRAA